MPIAKNDFLKDRALAAARARKLVFGGAKLGAKNDPKRRSTGEGILASIFHRFPSTLKAKMELSWERKSIKNKAAFLPVSECFGLTLGVFWGTRDPQK